MTRPRVLVALALAVLLAAGRAGAQSPADTPLAESGFAAGNDGWSSVTLPFPSAVPISELGTWAPQWVSGLGGYLRQDDPDGSQPVGHVQYWKAPAAYLGFKSPAYGGALQFDLATTGGVVFVQEDVLLVGAGLVLTHALGGTPSAAFSTWSVPLSESGWTVDNLGGAAATAQQMQQVLFDLDALYVRAEFVNGPDTEFLDSVALHAGPAAGGPWHPIGFGLAGAAGVPALAGSGPLTPGSAGSLTLAGAAPSAPAILFISFGATPTPFKGGTLVTVPVGLLVNLGTSGAGGFTLPFTWPAGLPSGTLLAFQCAVQDAGGPQGAALSNGLVALTP